MRLFKQKYFECPEFDSWYEAKDTEARNTTWQILENIEMLVQSAIIASCLMLFCCHKFLSCLAAVPDQVQQAVDTTIQKEKPTVVKDAEAAIAMSEILNIDQLKPYALSRSHEENSVIDRENFSQVIWKTELQERHLEVIMEQDSDGCVSPIE